MKAIQKLFFLSLFLIMALTACQEDVPPVVVEVIKAIAGEDREVPTGTEVLLNGAAEGVSRAVAYEWRFKSKPANSNAQITEANKAAARFTPDLVGPYLLELKVSKNDKSHADEILINALTPENAAILISEDINVDRVLEDLFEDPFKADYIVTTNVAVNAKLTVKPGVTIKFQHNTGLTVALDGTLIAQGVSANRVIFTGVESVKGYWKGIFVNSNNSLNELSHVLVSFGGSGSFSESPGIKANILLNGSNISGVAMKISNSSIMESDGYGLYVKGLSYASGIAGNHFSQNKLASAYIPAHMLHLLDFHTNFKDNNGFDGVEIGGELNLMEPVQWTAFNDGSKYLVSQDLKIKSGLKIMEGAKFEVKSNTLIEVSEGGYLDATGSEMNPISFSSHSKTPNGYWKGILFKSGSLSNKLIRTEVSYAGSAVMPGMDKLANVAVSNTGKLLVRNSRIMEGKGYGIAASQANQLNSDIGTSNVFAGLPLGNVFPTGLADPDKPSLTGDWVDWWSFDEEHFTIDPKFYDKANGVWFKGATDPWHMNPQQGFGIKFLENGRFVWTVAEKHNSTQCISYSAEFITGTVQSTASQLTLTQDYWRSKFVNSCATEQNSDETIAPGNVVLRYEINKVYHHFTGQAFWELKFFNPDNSTFSYFRL